MNYQTTLYIIYSNHFKITTGSYRFCRQVVDDIKSGALHQQEKPISYMFQISTGNEVQNTDNL